MQLAEPRPGRWVAYARNENGPTAQAESSTHPEAAAQEALAAVCPDVADLPAA